MRLSLLLSTPFLLAASCVDPGVDSGEIGSVSQASAVVGAWNSCYILSEDYLDWVCTSPDPGGPLCIEQWGSFPSACQEAGSSGSPGCNLGELPTDHVSFAPGKRCNQVGHIGIGTDLTTCNYGTFSSYNAEFSWVESASTYNCVETPPSVSNVWVYYDAGLGRAAGQYTYSHSLDAPEGRSRYTWYWRSSGSSDTPYGAGPVSHARSYTVDSWVAGNYLKFCVEPVLEVLDDDGNNGGKVGSEVCSGWHYIASVPSSQTPPTAAEYLNVSFAGNVAQLNYDYTFNGPQTTEGTKNRALTPEDNNGSIQLCVTQTSDTQTGTQACSPPTPVGHLLEMYKDDGLEGRNVNLPYEAKGSGYCFNDFRGYQLNDTMTSGIIHAPTDYEAVVFFYEHANCSGSSTTVRAPASSDTYYSLAQNFNDKVSSVRVVWNATPHATSVGLSVSWGASVGYYGFSDPLGLPESNSSYEFRRADDANGTNATTIATGIVQHRENTTRTFTPGDNHKWLQFCVTPSNGYFTGTKVCSGWGRVGPLAELFQDINYGGTSVNLAYTLVQSGYCINLTNFNFNDALSSMRLYATSHARTGFVFFQDINCSGNQLSFSVGAGGDGGSNDLTAVGWNDKASSMSVTWNNVYEIKNQRSGLVMDVSGVSTSDGAKLQQWGWGSGANQKFALVPTSGDPTYYQLIAQHSGRCVDVSGVSTSDGAAIQQWGCGGGENQKFKLQPMGDGSYQLVAKHSGKCIGVTGSSANQGASLVQWTCSTNANSDQRWLLILLQQ